MQGKFKLKRHTETSADELGQPVLFAFSAPIIPPDPEQLLVG